MRQGNTILTVGLEDPHNTQKVVGTVDISHTSICGSSGNRRAWAGYHHIIDPHTGISPQHIAALWVIAREARIADALTTALFFTTPDKLIPYFTFEYAILHADRTVDISTGFAGHLFTT